MWFWVYTGRRSYEELAAIVRELECVTLDAVMFIVKRWLLLLLLLLTDKVSLLTNIRLLLSRM